MTVIVDYGMGNLGSIANMLAYLGFPSTISGDASTVLGADRLILPGVGAFDVGMSRLEERGLPDALRRKALEEGVPFLGICLGMQLLTRRSEEGRRDGLAWIAAETRRFVSPPGGPPLRVPHMGWNTVRVARAHPLLEGVDAASRFYFVHSYHVVCERDADVLARTAYGAEFHSVVGHGSVAGTQFHPEKSHRFGMTVLGNFMRWNP